MRLRYPDQTGWLSRITAALSKAEGFIGTVDIIDVSKGHITRDITVQTYSAEHGQKIVEAVRLVDGVEVVSVSDRTFLLHRGGKIEVVSKSPIKTRDDLSRAYTPGVARVCRAIADDPEKSFSLTIRHNMVAVVTDGSAVLGLGNIGPAAALPVMEGKASLFKEFGDVDAFPICLDTQDTERIIETVHFLAPTFGGINLEDISSPRCVEIEERLIEELDIPVFHDDQHGTAIVVLAALLNSLKIVDKKMSDIRVAISGAGAAGAAIAKLLMSVGTRQIVCCDRKGAIHGGQTFQGNPVKLWLAENTNPDNIKGTINEAVRGADVFIGVSTASVLSVEALKTMAADPIVFGLANPDPEIDPDLAQPYAKIVATGRSDYANQINNVLCFPGLFRGMLDVRARRVTDEMTIAAARAIADVISADELAPQHIIPSVFDRRVAKAVAHAVSEAAITAGVARREATR